MKFAITLTLALLSMNLFACQTPHQQARDVSSQALPSGGRSGLHGMVIFGNGSYFIEHIPMLHPPHDFQIVASVVIKNKAGQILTPDFSKKGFTLKPAKQFSLNDFINGKLIQFNSEIYQGSFEQNGQLIAGLENVSIEIQKILLSRQLPSASTEKFFEVTDGAKNIFQTEIITPANNVQSIKNISLGKNLWCVTGPDFFQFCN